MRLTADLLLSVSGYLNTNKERECSLRGLKVPAIENLAVMQDQYSSIDLTDNEVKKLDNFPLMNRIETLMLANNHISKLSVSLGKQLPNLQNLVLTNNRIGHLNELKHLVKCSNLKHLSCLDNPVSTHSHYRLYVIYYLSSGVDPSPKNKNEEGDVLPNLKTLDFQKITVKERASAIELFTSEVGRKLLEQIKTGYAEEVKKDAASNMMVGHRGVSNQPAWMIQAPVASSSDDAKSTKQSMGELTVEQKTQVRQAIEGAKTKVEIDRIELQLQTGTFPFFEEVAKSILEEENKEEKETPVVKAPPKKRGRSTSVVTEKEEKVEEEEEEVVVAVADTTEQAGKDEEEKVGKKTVGKKAVEKKTTKGRGRSTSVAESVASVEEVEVKEVVAEKPKRGRKAAVKKDAVVEEAPVKRSRRGAK